jgi:hypothetical protein
MLAARVNLSALRVPFAARRCGAGGSTLGGYLGSAGLALGEVAFEGIAFSVVQGAERIDSGEHVQVGAGHAVTRSPPGSRASGSGRRASGS